MSRLARVISPTGFYHAISRGVNRSVIFEETSDYSMFLEIVKKCRNALDFEVFAYCLMSNHYHIIIKDPENRLDIIFKKINTTYAMYFNTKYERTGHLFQDRFKSEPILTDAQLLRTIAYIHRNPVKAGICSDAAAYSFSSYNDMLWRSGDVLSPGIIDNIFCDDSNFLKINGSDPENRKRSDPGRA